MKKQSGPMAGRAGAKARPRESRSVCAAPGRPMPYHASLFTYSISPAD